MKELIEEIEKILALGTKQVTLTNNQLSRLIKYAKTQAKKTRDAETQNMRLTMHRAEEALTATALRLRKVRGGDDVKKDGDK